MSVLIGKEAPGGDILTIAESGSTVRAAVDPVLTDEDNDSGELKFTILPDNPEYDAIQTMVSTIVVMQENAEIWRGRAIDQTRSGDGTKTMTCKGIMDYFHDGIIQPFAVKATAANALGKILQLFNGTTIESYKHFYVGNVLGIPNIDYELKNPRTCWDVLKELLRKYEGSLRCYRKSGRNYIDWRAEKTGCRDILTQDIEYGKNLIRLPEIAASCDGLCTVLYGQGKKTGDSPLTIGSINGGKIYVEDAAAIAAFGRIEDSMTDSSIETAEELKTAMEEELEKRKMKLTEITAEAVDLADLGESSQPLRAGAFVKLSCAPLGINETVLIRRIVRHLFAPEQTVISLGTTITAASRIMGGNAL